MARAFTGAEIDEFSRAGAASLERDTADVLNLDARNRNVAREDRIFAQDATQLERQKAQDAHQKLQEELAQARENRLQAVNDSAALEAIRKEKALAGFHSKLAAVDPTKVNMREVGPALIAEFPEAMGDERAVRHMDYNMKLYDDHQKALSEKAAQEARTLELKNAGMTPKTIKIGDTTFEQPAKEKELTPAQQELQISRAENNLFRARSELAKTQQAAETKDIPYYDALETHNKNVESALNRLGTLDPENTEIATERQAVAQRRNAGLVGKHDLIETQLASFKTPDGNTITDPQKFAAKARELNAIKDQLGYNTIDPNTGKEIPRVAPSGTTIGSVSVTMPTATMPDFPAAAQPTSISAPVATTTAMPVATPTPVARATPLPSQVAAASTPKVRRYNPVTGKVE